MNSQVRSSILFRAADSPVSAGWERIPWDSSWLPALTLLISDLLTWPGLFLLLSQLRMAFVGSIGQFGVFVLILPAIFGCLALYTVGAYDRRSQMLTLNYAIGHLLSLAVSFVVTDLVLSEFVTFGDLIKPSRLIFVVNCVAFASVTLVIRRWHARTLRAHQSRQNFVVIAPEESAARFAKDCRRHGMLQELRVHAKFPNATNEVIVDREAENFGAGWEEVFAQLDRNTAGLILGIPTSKVDPDLARLLVLLNFRCVPVYTIDSFFELAWRQVSVENIEPWWGFSQRSALARHSVFDHLKRWFDLLFSAVALVILLPLLLIVAVIIRWDSPGPSLFRQTRLGRDEKPFTLLKFRSMRLASENDSIYTSKNDSRITRIGKILRRTRLDELPQLVNVLKGEMSMIGPRAEWIKCTEIYERELPFYHYRHLVRPGITGWAQVCYGYGESKDDAMEKLRYDLYYVRHCSFVLDLTIILKTIQIMASARGR
jgi:exopolysaccharide biosynthesis polyprenyl glycosylphosphotransferase